MSAIFQRSSVPTQAEFHAAIASRSDCWYAACLRITRSQELAEDAVQDALLNAWRKRRQFKHDAQLETWIHRIAVNSALQLMRRQRPGLFTLLDSDHADASESAEARQLNAELARNFTEACSDLSEIERICFTLKHLEEWRLKEIAAELDTTVGNVKQAIFRAVRKLRARMTGPECVLERNPP
ncbi:MAG: sigma-70 family RNA polymerase sigma factor [Xanthomonadales bacterium]|nr:sigma-70 family RNA polymerase sigma factor [Xanthomonadales bacterium]